MRDTVHIPDDLQKRVTALVPAINAQVLLGTANSTAVIRHALALGLTLMEQAVAAGKPIPQARDINPPPEITTRWVEVPAVPVVPVTHGELLYTLTGTSLTGTSDPTVTGTSWPEIPADASEPNDGWAPQ